MADEKRVAAGKRFSRDMRLIREDRGTSQQEIHKETRIARSLIESFEEGGLYDHPTFNEVYLRSFVRAYAEVIDVSPEAALEGLESALEGSYENELADQYLASTSEAHPDSGDETTDRSSSPSSAASSEEDKQSSPAAPVAGGPEGRGGIVGPPRAVGRTQEDEPEDDTSVSREEGDDEAERGATEETSTDTSSPATKEQEEPSASADDASDEDTPEESAETGVLDQKPSDDLEEGDGEPMGADSIDEDPDDEESQGQESVESEDHPSWLDERPEEDEESTTGSEPLQSPDVPASGGDMPDRATGTGDTGIVGEPTAMGEQSSDAPLEGAQSPGPSPAPRSSRQRGWAEIFTGASKEMLWAGVGMVVILLVLAGLGVAYFSAQESATTQSRTASAPDTASAQPTDTADAVTPARPPPANVQLGDVLHLTVLATDDVSGIRIRRDEDLRRPYWIEDGDVSVFPFQNRLTLENELDNVQLFLEGYPFPLSETDTTTQVVITRSQVAAFVDTLRGAPANFSVEPDTIPVGELAQQ